MSKKLYLGWGKSMSGKYGDFWNLTIDLGKVSNNPHVIKEHKGKKMFVSVEPIKQAAK